MSVFILSFLSIICSSYTLAYPTFTEEIRLNHKLNLVKLNNATLFSYFNDSNTIITSTEPGFQECKIPGIIPPNRWTLGNGKIIAMTFIVTHFTILDYKNCSSYSTIFIDDGEPYKFDRDKEIETVVPYYDTFDVFGKNGVTCRPCRYNDKGERVKVEHSLRLASDLHEGFFVEPIENEFGIEKGYLYGFSFLNGTTILKVLNLDYNVVKQRSIKGKVIGKSFFHKTFTICYELEETSSVECQMLNWHLDAMKTMKMYRPGRRPSYTNLVVTNLATGGAMVSMEFTEWSLGSENTQDVYIQQIHANGTVDPKIYFASFSCDYVSVDDFMRNDKEYCLLTSVSFKKENSYTLIKCMIPES